MQGSNIVIRIGLVLGRVRGGWRRGAGGVHGQEADDEPHLLRVLGSVLGKIGRQEVAAHQPHRYLGCKERSRGQSREGGLSSLRRMRRRGWGGRGRTSGAMVIT
jgi:hypothetical protein